LNYQVKIEKNPLSVEEAVEKGYISGPSHLFKSKEEKEFFIKVILK
jgi:hypothetical protein